MDPSDISVSIVVPCYNGEQFLRPCIESLTVQTLASIEIILVDDGSVDSTWAIIKEYSDRDPRIRPIRQANSGVAIARKNGVLLARGEYIGFVDADDWVDANMYERLYTVARAENADAVECNKYGDGVTAWDGVYSRADFRERIARPHLLTGREVSLQWNRIYRNTPLLKTFDYGPPPLFEDYLFNLQFFLHVEKYVKLPDTLYHYRIIQNSLSRRYNDKTFSALKHSRQAKLALLPQYGWNSESDLDSDAHWFVTNALNIVRVLARSNRSLPYKVKEAQRILSDEEVKSALMRLKRAQRLSQLERLLLFQRAFALLYSIGITVAERAKQMRRCVVSRVRTTDSGKTGRLIAQ